MGRRGLGLGYLFMLFLLSCTNSEEPGRESAFQVAFPSPWLKDTALGAMETRDLASRIPERESERDRTEGDPEYPMPHLDAATEKKGVMGTSAIMEERIPSTGSFPMVPRPEVRSKEEAPVSWPSAPDEYFLEDGDGREQEGSPEDRWSRLEKTIERLHELQYPPEELGGSDPAPWTLAQVRAAALSSGQRGRKEGAKTGSGFYSVRAPKALSDNGEEGSFPAEVYEEQWVSPGSWVGLRLLVPLEVEGRVLPEGLRVFGRARASSDRIELSIHSLRFGDQILSVRLDLYDQDGQKGFYLPEKGRGLPEQGLDPVSSVWPKGKVSGILQDGDRILSRLRRPRAKPMRVLVPARYRVYLVTPKAGS